MLTEIKKRHSKLLFAYTSLGRFIRTIHVEGRKVHNLIWHEHLPCERFLELRRMQWLRTPSRVTMLFLFSREAQGSRPPPTDPAGLLAPRPRPESRPFGRVPTTVGSTSSRRSVGSDDVVDVTCSAALQQR